MACSKWRASDDAPRTRPFISRSRVRVGLNVGWSSFATFSTSTCRLQHNGGALMSLAIQGGFEAYLWATLWQIALGGLQIGALPTDPRRAGDELASRMQKAISFLGSAVSWGAWGLGVWVTIHSGLLAGVVFTALSFGVNVATIIELHRMRRDPVATQIAAFLMVWTSPARHLAQ
jgi:hypothetical protein